MSSEEDLMGTAKRYLKEEYGEDTVSMTVTKNRVANRNGELYVDCTVKYMGVKSDWSKVFTFRNGEVVYMYARPR